MFRKNDMCDTAWLQAYEDRNVEIALDCGFRGKAQIGKGAWAAPDQMHDMLKDKLAHPLAGASCAWVPSPTAATLHATHYHRLNVAHKQSEFARSGRQTPMAPLLRIPLARGTNWSEEDIAAEVDNNVQGILGYVVRWVDQGIGFSKVPDINDVGQMEDRATCRISAQHLANWRHHGVISAELVGASLHRMARLVDRQNADDPLYHPMMNGTEPLAFQAASDWLFKGAEQPSGYAEPLLHAYRQKAKAGMKN